MTTTTQDEHLLFSIDRDLLYLNAEEQQSHHLGLMTLKEQKQLTNMIKKAHRHIRKITTTLENPPPVNISSSISTATSTHPSSISDFFQQKHTKKLYIKLKAIKEKYWEILEQQQIRQLENDMERYQLLQTIHGLSSRLDRSSQVYDDLHHLHHALSSLRTEWKLDRIQHIVTTLAQPSTCSSTSPPSTISEHHGHRWYPLIISNNKKKRKANLSSSSSSSTAAAQGTATVPSSQPSLTKTHFGLFNHVKNWFRKQRHSILLGHSSETASSADKATTITATTTTTIDESRRRHRPQSHPHLFCSSQEECNIKVVQLVQDFQNVFEENARQNEERMHHLYARVFQPDIDPLLAEDIQRLCLAVSTAPPPSLASLMQPGLSSSCSWTVCVTTGQTSFLVPADNNNKKNLYEHMIYRMDIQQSSSFFSKKKTRNEKNNISSKQDKEDEGTTDQQEQQMWSICLGLLSEHLLGVGQQYYTRWMQEIRTAQQQQTAPFQVATETLASMYQALQIEQGYAILSRLCTHLESSATL
ncbi:uncharacterized protein BX664DRAFT_350044 [Halteromyces radiatus]|uniref:uncharacterized protein n=1 Tax=Halteromyces radiatus TaxID=101107 RepID=UPI00221FF626|nr:uncharacterized protein BX664DRAFT_350044 [Halteromyces radiatus]KAI8089670.1 hypothetical protein BX664DRAFT_350044 [Halteromyces radiatus]